MQRKEGFLPEGDGCRSPGPSQVLGRIRRFRAAVVQTGVKYIGARVTNPDVRQMVDKTAAIYVRDTPATDSKDEQLEMAFDYATQVLDLEQTDIEVLSDTAQHGRDAPKSSDQELFDLATDGAIEHVIVRDASRIATSMRDLHERVSQLVENDVAVHIIEPGLRINDPDGKTDEDIDDHTMLRVLGIAAELEAAVSSRRTQEGIAAAKAAGKHVGRPPFGFDSDGDGNLLPNDDFETALAVIEEVEAGESKRSVARRADITRATVRNIMDRKDLYRSGSP